MSTGVKVGVAFVLGAVLGGGGGFAGGTSLGMKTIAGGWALSEVNATDEFVEALELVRAKKDAEASAALEDHLDRHVVGIMPETRGELTIPESTLQRIAEVKKRVQAYRKANPRPATQAIRAKDVDAYLARD